MTELDGPIVEVASLHKAYGATVAVEDISFTVAEGEIFGILGPNGAGKTTTVSACKVFVIQMAERFGCSGSTRHPRLNSCVAGSVHSSRTLRCRAA